MRAAGEIRRPERNVALGLISRFVNGEISRLATPVTPTDEVAILMAMSGGQDRVDDHRGDAAATMFPDD